MSDLFSSILDDLSSFPSLTVDGDPPSTTGGLADLGSQAVGLSGSGGRKKSYRLFVVEASEAAGNVCFKQIGRSMTACVKSLCQTHHQKASSQPWDSETGTFYIMKTDTVIFMDPKVSSEKMTPDLYQYFLTAEQSIEEWSEKFAFIASSDSVSITMEQMASGEANNRKASDYKTPTKFLGVDILPELGLLAYQREVLDPESLAADDGGLLRMARILGDIESSLIENAAALNTMHTAMGDELTICRATSGFLLTKIERSQALLGEVSDDINN